MDSILSFTRSTAPRTRCRSTARRSMPPPSAARHATARTPPPAAKPASPSCFAGAPAASSLDLRAQSDPSAIPHPLARLRTVWVASRHRLGWLTSMRKRQPSLHPNSNVVSNAVEVAFGKNGPCPQRYRWHLEKNATQMAAISQRLTCQPFMGMRGSTSSFQSPASPSSTIAPATSVVSVGLVHHSSNPSAGQAAEGGVTWARQEPIGTVVRGEAAAWPLQCSLRPQHLALTAWALTDCLSGNCALALPHGDGVDGRQAGSRGTVVGRVHAGDGCEGREPVPGTGEAGGAGAAVLGCESAAGNPRVPVQNS